MGNMAPPGQNQGDIFSNSGQNLFGSTTSNPFSGQQTTGGQNGSANSGGQFTTYGNSTPGSASPGGGSGSSATATTAPATGAMGGGAAGGGSSSGASSGLSQGSVSGVPELDGGGTMQIGGGGSQLPGGGSLNSSSGYPGAGGSNNSINSGSYQQATGAASEFFNGNSSIYDPFQADQNLSSSVASFGGQAIPGAAAWQQQLFAPGFNPTEQAYMQNVSQQQQQVLNQQMAQLGSQFSDTPMHSSYLNQANQLGQVAGQNVLNSGLQLAQNRQGLAGQAAGRILGSPLAATQQGTTDTTTMMNMINGLQQGPFSSAMSYLSNSPILSPTVTPGVTSGGGGKKG